ncbi:MAG: alpha/beta fold hydrolase [Myxococcota bacterium]
MVAADTTVGATPSPRCFELSTSAFRLEGGARLPRHHVRGFWWGPEEDLPWLAARAQLLAADDPCMTREQPVARGEAPVGKAVDARIEAPPPPERSTVLVVHALTADCRVGGEGGWWGPLVGPGEPLDPTRMRVLCFNNLGSCYGTFGPEDTGYPRLADEPEPPSLLGKGFTGKGFTGKGAFSVDPRAPATLTTWDQARSILLALDALGIDRVDLVVGGSVGGMITLCLAVLAPDRFARVVPVATAPRSTSWIRGFNHIARMAILADPGFPDDPARGLELARQIAHVTYRAEAGLAGHDPPYAATWHGATPLRVQTYLEYQGRKLRARFFAGAYLAQLCAMDHHDLERRPSPPETEERWTLGESWGTSRLCAPTYAIGVDSDQLFPAHHGERLAAQLAERGVVTGHYRITSPNGHDAFLLEWDQLREALRAAWDLG